MAIRTIQGPTGTISELRSRQLPDYWVKTGANGKACEDYHPSDENGSGPSGEFTTTHATTPLELYHVQHTLTPSKDANPPHKQFKIRGSDIRPLRRRGSVVDCGSITPTRDLHFLHPTFGTTLILRLQPRRQDGAGAGHVLLGQLVGTCHRARRRASDRPRLCIRRTYQRISISGVMIVTALSGLEPLFFYCGSRPKAVHLSRCLASEI